MNKHLRIKVGSLIVIGLVFGAGAATADDSEKTKLDGTLTIDFTVPDVNPTIPAGYRFTVAKDKKYSLYDPSGALLSDFPVPEAIRGGTFTLNAECIGILHDGTAGGSQLRVQLKDDRGTLYRALVTSGAFNCLILGGATRVDALFDDPFIGNVDPDFFIAGERGIWLAQILDSAESVAEGVNTLRAFFEIPAAQTVVEPKYRTVEVSGYLNRGGSALGVVNKHITLTFKQPSDNDDDSDSNSD